MTGRMEGMAAAALLGLAVPAAAQPIADSVLDFSGVQEQANWAYGYYWAGMDANGVYEPAVDFVPFDAGQFNGSVWRFSGSGQPATTVSAVGGVPNGTDTVAGEQWAMRRWTSPVAGRLLIEGLFGELDTRGGGTTGRIFVDDVEVFTRQEAGSPRPFSVDVRVATGSTVDFAIDPNGDGRFDLARLSAVMTWSPCRADLDENGRIDVFDLLAFLDQWFSGSADFDGDGATTAFDAVEFVTVWFQGPSAC